MAQIHVKKRGTVTDKQLVTNHTGSASIFSRDNLVWMIAGAVVMIIGYLLMSGGRSEDPNVFNPAEVYSTRRITIAPAD